MLTVAEVAAELGISTRRVQFLIAQGRLKARRIGPLYVIRPQDVEAIRVRDRPPGRPKKKIRIKRGKGLD